MPSVRSATKVPLATADLARLVDELHPGAVVSRELGGGMFNIAYAIETPTFADVVKIAPPSDAPVLTYEHDLIAAELEFFDRARGLPVPTVRARSLDRARPAFLMDLLPGAPANDVKLAPAAHASVRRSLGRGLAELRGVEGEAFGYLRPDGSFRADTWEEAFGQMIDAVFADARTWNVRLPAASGRLPALVTRARPLLAEVATPRLTHFDLWDGNLFVETEGEDARLSGVIDGERRFWGDPLAEFASTSLFRDAQEDTALLAGMAEGGHPVDFTPSVRARIALYRAYLSLIMLVEAAPRRSRGFRAWMTARYVRSALANQLEEADAALRAHGV